MNFNFSNLLFVYKYIQLISFKFYKFYIFSFFVFQGEKSKNYKVEQSKNWKTGNLKCENCNRNVENLIKIQN